MTASPVATIIENTFSNDHGLLLMVGLKNDSKAEKIPGRLCVEEKDWLCHNEDNRLMVAKRISEDFSFTSSYVEKYNAEKEGEYPFIVFGAIVMSRNAK